MDCYRFCDAQVGGSRRIPQFPYIFQTTEGRRLSPRAHTHDFYEICFLLRGAAEQRIEEDVVRLGTGEGILLTPGASHRFLSQAAETNVLALSVEAEEFSVFARAFGLSERLCRGAVRFSAGEELPALLRRVRACAEAGDNRLFLCRALLTDCLILIGSSDTDGDMPLSRWLTAFRRPEHLREGMGALCRLSGYSPSQLTRLFRKYRGETPHDFIRTERMSYAYCLLTGTDMGTEAVADACGYASVGHFCRVFAAHFGLTPAAARKRAGFLTV